MSNETQGRKEFKEAVVIATLSAVFVGVVNIGIDEFKEWRKRRDAARAAKKTDEVTQ